MLATAVPVWLQEQDADRVSFALAEHGQAMQIETQRGHERFARQQARAAFLRTPAGEWLQARGRTVRLTGSRPSGQIELPGAGRKRLPHEVYCLYPARLRGL